MARSLEIHDDPRTARRIKAAQRVGMGLLAVLLAAAAIGLLGLGGPLSNARSTVGQAEVTSPRFARYLAPTSIEIETSRATSDSVTVTLQGDHAEAFLVETIRPRPEEVASTGDATVYRFAAVPGQPHHVLLEGQMESIGPLSGAVRVDDGPAAAIDTFVYP